MNDRGQLHTLEGLAAAILMTLAALMITQSIMLVNPQNEMAVDVQIEQMSSDALAVLDLAPDTAFRYNLTECVASWNMTEASYPANNLELLDESLSEMLSGISYNVNLAYVENGNPNVKKAIINGQPGENAVVVRRYVTLTNKTVHGMGGGWGLADDEIKVVEVRMTAWKV